MNKSSFFTETENFVRRSLLLTLASIVLSVVFATNVTQSQTSEVNAHITYNKIAKNWIQKGYNQYNEGLYEEAEKSLSQAQSYDEYLNSTERKVLDELLDKTRTARYESKRVSDTYKLVASLIKQGKLTEAKAHLKRIKEYKSLSKKEQAQIDEAIKKIDIRITPENAGIARDTLDIFKELGGESSEELKETEKSQKLQENEIANLYYRSIGLYRTGQLEKARKGFVTVINSGLVPESMVNAIKKHVKKIDETMARRTKTEIKSLRAGRQPMTSRSRLIVPRTSGQIRVARPQAAAPVTGESSYIEVANRKRNILKGHTKAVVDDAVTKTHIYINQGEFDKAQEVVASAEFAVNKNQMYLGEIHYKQYIHMLQQLSKKIDEAKNESTELEDLMKREAAIASQRKFRKQMEMEKEERIKTLMKNARAYQRQQRYEAALGALKSLLAIDPQNDDALILKDTLEDTIYFKRQLEVEKDSGKQRADILLKTDEAGVPYADEIRYPKNWKEIIAKPTRQPDEPIGLDPADVAVYQQLDTVVDLSELTPTMPLGEAIEIIKNSVKPQLNIIPLWRDLYDRAQIDQTTQINMDGLPAIRLVTGLEYLLKAVSGGYADLGYVVENGVITIATIDALPSKLETRVYDITDLLGEPASFFQMPTMMGFGGGYGMSGGGGGFGGGWMSAMRAEDLIMLIQDTIDPDSWYDLSDTGEGTITTYPRQQPKKLAVLQTREVHKRIEKLLKEMRKALGYQVSIEARFLSVSENFLEDIGLDIDFEYNVGGKWGLLKFSQTSAVSTAPDVSTKVPGSLGGISPAIAVEGGYGSILNDLQVAFILRATQAHTDAKTLTAPKVTVLSGESAVFQIQRQISYALPPDIVRSVSRGYYTGGGLEEFGLQQNVYSIPVGTLLNITPIITPDKRNVLLNIVTQMQDLLRIRTHTVAGIVDAGDGEQSEIVEYPVSVPETETSQVMTRVSIPDGGTLLLGGQKITVELNKEAGVPVLSKIPIIGRMFSNRSTIKDQQILLILVKPTIILQEEREAEAIATISGI